MSKTLPPRLWFLTPVETVGSPVVGLTVAIALTALNLALAHSGPSPDPTLLRFAIYFPLALGYTLAAAAHLFAAVQRDVPAVGAVDRLSWPAQTVASLAGLLVVALLLAQPQATSGPRPSGHLDELLATQAVIAWLLWAPLFYLVLRCLWRLRRFGLGADVNLLDLTPLHALGRAASRLALFVALLGVIFTVVTIVGREGGLLAELPSVVSLTLFLVAAIYLPLSGVRKQIRRAKHAEIERIAANLGDHRDVLSNEQRLEQVEHLLAYREQIVATSEWPLGLGGGLRTRLYVALPLLSWLGAALADRAIEMFWR